MSEDGAMTWAWVYLAVSLVGALLVVNAFRPARHPLLGVPSFFAGWYTAEMPVWHIVWQVAATVAFALVGALGSWPGWVALGVNAAAWTGLVVHARLSDRVRHVFSLAEEEVPLPVVEEGGLPLHGGETMWRFPRLVYPLPRPARSVQALRNIDYVGDGIRAHRLDIIRRRVDPPTGAPVLIYIHGGAWVIGDKREQGLPLLHELARRGWVAVTINYRLSPRATWPDHIVDCKRAVAWVRENIAEYGGDPAFVAVSGGSAGGHLAALVGLTSGDPQFQPGFEGADASVDACVPCYGVYDMTAGRGTSWYDEGLLTLLERRVFKRRLADDPEVFEAASPLHRVHPEAPPFFVIHGTNDTLVPVADARTFVSALRAVSKAPVLYAELPYTQHAFDVLPSVRSAHAVAAVVRFLEGVRSRRSAGAREGESQAPRAS
ncbi:MAG TPA: alpha/beta hydrolase [Acidimicrobiales bacterium]|nr:alpha/beta hydrolase [Acidimicrobiales bacterium]